MKSNITPLNSTKSKCSKNKIYKFVMSITVDSDIKYVTYCSRSIALTCSCCFETYFVVTVSLICSGLSYPCKYTISL